MNLSKKVIIFMVSVVIVLGIGGVWYWKHASSPASEGSKFISYNDPKLTDAEKTVFTGKINEYEKKLAEAKTKDEQFTYSVQVGAEYYGLGEYEKARNKYLSASELLPDNPTSWAELAVVETAMTDYASAYGHIRKALEINPASSQYWRRLIGLKKDNMGASDVEMENLYAEALTKTNKNADIIGLHAIFLEERKKDLPGALAEWRLANSVNPDGKERYEEQIKRIQDLVK